MKQQVTFFLLLLGLSSISLARNEKSCLTDHQTKDIITRWTSIAIKINLQVVNETVTDDFQFFSDSQDFLEGLPYGSATGVPSIANKTDLIQQQEAAQIPGTPVIPSRSPSSTRCTAAARSRSGGASTPNMVEIFQARKFSVRLSALSMGQLLFMGAPESHLLSSTDRIGDPIEYSGIDILVLADDSNLIQTAYSEWNNGELLYDLGTRTCFQKGNASACL